MTACRVDCHVKVLDEGVVERARAAGLDAIVYAPHFTRLPRIRERAERHSCADLTVIPAREIFTGTWRTRKHVLALDLEAPIPDFITLEAAMAELERQDAVVCAPHPEFATVSLTEADIREYRDVIDAVEVFNPKHLRWHNREARAIASRLDLPAFTSSYAHLRRTVGAAHTVVQADVDGPADLLTALREGAPRRVVRPVGLEWVTTALPEMAHLFYENSWKKIDRLFLSGTEATHPRHIAYGGRFADAMAY